MSKRNFRSALVIGILLVLFLSIQPVQARRWMYGDDRYWGPMRVCRDGAVVVGGVEGTYDAMDFQFQARNFPFSSTMSVPYYFNGDSYVPGPYEDYGPTISTPLTQTLRIDPRPYSLNTDRSSSFGSFGFLTFTWDQLLSPESDRVILIELFTHYGTASLIEDCTINQFYFAQGAPLEIGSDRLNPGSNLLSAADLQYRVEVPPSNGLLRRNGSPLNEGDTFTQADVNAGLIDYFPNGNIYSGDYFEYTLTGLRRISVSTAGEPGNGDSTQPSISADGTLVAFASVADNLVTGDTLGFSDVFVRNLPENRTSRVSINNSGQQGNGDSYHADIAPDGEAVAFASLATNLVPGSPSVCEQAQDNNLFNDIYVRINDPWQIYRYSVPGDCADSDGDSYRPAASNRAQVVAFNSWATNFLSPPDSYNNDIYQHTQPPNGATSPLSVSVYGGTANGDSGPPSITDDGAYVAFASYADDLVVDDPNGGIMDVFVRGAGTTVMITRSPNGDGSDGYSYDPSISADGRFVVYSSDAQNLGDNIQPSQPNYYVKIYVHDRDCDLDGVFDEGGDCQPGYLPTALLPVGYNNDYYGPGPDGSSYWPVLSADGRFVAFASYANNLVEGDSDNNLDIFVVDRDPDRNGLFEPTLFRVVRATEPLPGSINNGDSYDPAISDDGRYVAFTSDSSNLVPNDTNNAMDVFLFYTGATEAFPILTHTIFLPFTVK